MCNFYVQNMLYLGVWGLAPRKNLKISCLRLNLLAILANDHCLKCIALMNDCSIRITDCSIRVSRFLKVEGLSPL